MQRARHHARILILVLLASCTAASRPSPGSDVVVYGSTPGGFCAAIAAAREGASVVLLEPTGHVGGMSTGGLSFSDSNQTVRSTVMGLFHEWHARIEQDYRSRGIRLPYQVALKDQARWTYEPHVAMRITRAMLAEAGVTVLTGRVLQSVTKDGARIRSLRTADGAFAGRVFIDATYEGDLLAAAGVSFALGREGRSAFGESLAGKQYPKKEMPIDGFDRHGKMLPLITTTDPGPETDGDANVMVYSFRLCLTRDPHNRLPMPAPDHYDPARFEVVRRAIQAKAGRVAFDLYDLPGGKLDGNNSIGGQFSIGLVGGARGWSEASAADRTGIWQAHRQYTLEFYRFLTTDASVPANIRKRFADLGLCKDEFVETDHWPPQLYVREGRRLRGMYVLSQKDILEEPAKDDPIIVSSFPIDSHDCQRVARPGGGVINEGTIFPVRMKGRRHGYPYQVPYRSILPRPDECDNLLVPVALSATHVALSSIRVEPTWMILGQSAGIAAARIARADVAAHRLPYPELREALLAQQQVLELPAQPASPPADPGRASPPRTVDPKTLPGIVLDDGDALLQGAWKRSALFRPHVGAGYIHDDQRGDGQSAATFRFRAPRSGRYELRMAYSAHPSRATNVPLVVQSGPRRIEIAIDQSAALPVGKLFRPIQTIALSAEQDTVITIRNAGTDGFVILDALQLLPVPD